MVGFLERHEGFSFRKEGKYYRSVEHNSLIIGRDRKKWWWNSQDVKGTTAIDYLMRVDGMAFPQAVHYLNGDSGRAFLPSVVQEQPEIIFSPPQRTSMPPQRLLDYLCGQRLLDRGIVADLIKRGLIYQDVQNNAVFIGRDEQGKICYACLRGTGGTRFRMDVEGSKKDYSFSLEGTGRDCVSVFESPIDMLSACTLLNEITGNQNAWKRLCAVSLAGNSDVALAHYLSVHPEVKAIYTCLDNDEGGVKGAKAMKEKYSAMGYAVKDKRPHFKDYNEELKAVMSVREAVRTVPRTSIQLHQERA